MVNSINKIIFDLSNELDSMLKAELYRDYGKLMRGSSSLFQYAFENDILLMSKDIIDESYSETFTVIGYNTVFPLDLIGIDYQEK